MRRVAVKSIFNRMTQMCITTPSLLRGNLPYILIKFVLFCLISCFFFCKATDRERRGGRGVEEERGQYLLQNAQLKRKVGFPPFTFWPNEIFTISYRPFQGSPFRYPFHYTRLPLRSRKCITKWENVYFTFVVSPSCCLFVVFGFFHLNFFFFVFFFWQANKHKLAQATRLLPLKF